MAIHVRTLITDNLKMVLYTFFSEFLSIFKFWQLT